MEHNNTELDTVCKHNKGAIQVNLEPGTTQNADSGLTEVNVNKMNALTHEHDSSVSVKDTNLTNSEHNTEQNTISKHNEGEIEGNPLPGIHTEHVNEEVQNSLTKANGNTTLHELSNVACALNTTEVLKIKNT